MAPYVPYEAVVITHRVAIQLPLLVQTQLLPVTLLLLTDRQNHVVVLAESDGRVPTVYTVLVVLGVGEVGYRG